MVIMWRAPQARWLQQGGYGRNNENKIKERKGGNAHPGVIRIIFDDFILVQPPSIAIVQSLREIPMV